jgi:hypothetical protein
MFLMVSLMRKPLWPKESFKFVPGPTVMMLTSAFSLSVMLCPDADNEMSPIKNNKQFLIT